MSSFVPKPTATTKRAVRKAMARSRHAELAGEILSQLEQLQELVIESGKDRAKITWGSVGDLGHVRDKLQDLVLFMEEPSA